MPRSDLHYYEGPLSREQYLNNRLLPKINLYFNLSRKANFAFRALTFLSLVLTASIPVLIKLNIVPEIRDHVLLIISLLLILLSALGQVFAFREKYINYKRSEDQLFREYQLFAAGVQPYEGIESLKTFIENCENIILKERREITVYSTRSRIKAIEHV